MNNAQSGTAAFEPRARLLKLIGAELISDEVVAITELVKNAHDADASEVRIEFIGVTGDEGEILIRDNGHGMDLDTLMNRWMQPAGSIKGREGRRFSRGGRRVLGEKGVGRFAADKLAAHLELVSRPTGAASEIHAVFDWDEFEHDDRMLSDVHSRWQVRSPDWLEEQGTVLRMTELRARWNERLFKRLSTRLSRLISPFGTGANGFQIIIESDEFPSYSGELSSGFVDEAPYSMDADFDGESLVTMRICKGSSISQSWTGRAPLRCGPVRVKLLAFDLETEALARIGPRTDVRAWLREWSGISVYRDGFRIWPYGEPHDDWLRLDQRRVNNPVVKLSNNQVVGFIEIGADRNPELRDQTNREGLIRNDAFTDLQRLVLHLLDMLEAERQARRHPEDQLPGRGKPGSRKETEGDGIPESLERLARQTDGPLGNELRRTAEKIRTRFEAQEQTHRRTLDGYSDLAALGHSATLFGRNINAGLAEMKQHVDTLRTALNKKRGVDPSSLAGTVAELQDRMDRLLNQLTLVSAAGGGPSRRRRGLDVPAELELIRQNLQAMLETEDASLEVQSEDGVLLRTEMRPEVFASLISVLVKNSTEWRHDGKRLQMHATVREAGDCLELLFSDNGQGVIPALEDKLMEPGVSGNDSAGMGLTIARNIAVSHGGQLTLVIDRRRKGATFSLKLPRKRSRATPGKG